MATLDNGAKFYANLAGAEVGLAFIQHIDSGKDSSFLIPIALTSPEQTAHMDTLLKAVFQPDKFKNLLKHIKKSKPQREFWEEAVNLAKLSISSPEVVMPRQPLDRATNWHPVEPSEGDYVSEGGFPIFWYTYPGKELKLDFWLKYKMEWRALFHRQRG